MAKKSPGNLPSNPPIAKPTKPKKPAKAKSAPQKRAPGELPWHLFWRCGVSLLIVLHLTALFCAPWNLLITRDALPPGYGLPLDAQGRLQPVPPPESPIWQEPIIPRRLHEFFHDYLNVLYLNHGYEFFAPVPMGTHVIDYQVTQPNGEVVAGRFPSLDEQWPRLFYNRHMMLTEQTQLQGSKSGRHYADYLATRYGGVSHLQLKMHFVLSPYQVAKGTSPEDPSTYEVIKEVTGRPRPSAQPNSNTPNSNTPNKNIPSKNIPSKNSSKGSAPHFNPGATL